MGAEVQIRAARQSAALSRNDLAARSGVHQPNIAAYESGSRRLPRELTESHPEIQISAITGMRDIIAYQYGEVDYRILWSALTCEFPVDATRGAQILDL